MEALLKEIRRWEFEARILVSLGIVLVVCVLSSVCFGGSHSNVSLIGRLLGLSERASLSSGYLLAALSMAVASLLRMWAGSVLTSNRVMAFRVQKDRLLTRGPYRIVRNPIYLADLIAMCGFALCLPPPGVLLPLLIYLHYLQLVKYEEVALAAEFGQDYSEYARCVPKLLLGPRSLRRVSGSFKEFQITHDGIRHNALYVLFAVGFIVAAFTQEFFHAVAIGLPAVYDWAVLHTKKGLPDSSRDNGSDKGKRRRKRSKVFEDVLYAQCWEDPQTDRHALQIGPNDVVFSITSGGCNTLAFLLDNPRKVIALDLNPCQNHLLELKMAAFQRLEYDELLEFVGVRNSIRRVGLYFRLRSTLSELSRQYWDREANKIEDGILHCGRYERYMRLLRWWVTRIVGRKTIEKFFEISDPQERARLFREEWENVRWWIFTRVLLSRATMTLLFDRAFFRYLDRSFSFGKHFAEKARRALTELPTRENPFLSYILLGRFWSDDNLPLYLRRESYEVIRSRVHRIEIVTDSCEHYFSALRDSSISKFNFSNIFEWMSTEAFHNLLCEIVRIAGSGAFLAYRNLLVRRERPESLERNIQSHHHIAQALHKQDLSFIYDRYVVEQISKRSRACPTVSNRSATVAQ